MTGKEIEKATQGIYPLQNTAIRKVKILRAPKFDLTKLLEVHGDYSEEAGAKVGLHQGITPRITSQVLICEQWWRACLSCSLSHLPAGRRCSRKEVQQGTVCFW